MILFIVFHKSFVFFPQSYYFPFINSPFSPFHDCSPRSASPFGFPPLMKEIFVSPSLMAIFGKSYPLNKREGRKLWLGLCSSLDTKNNWDSFLKLQKSSSCVITLPQSEFWRVEFHKISSWLSRCYLGPTIQCIVFK